MVVADDVVGFELSVFCPGLLGADFLALFEIGFSEFLAVGVPLLAVAVVDAVVEIEDKPRGAVCEPAEMLAVFSVVLVVAFFVELAVLVVGDYGFCCSRGIGDLVGASVEGVVAVKFTLVFVVGLLGCGDGEFFGLGYGID